MKQTTVVDCLSQLLVSGVAGTQENIRSQLQRQGYEVTQSKVSRMLRKLGAVKTVDEQGNSIYRLAHDPMPLATTRSLASLIIDIIHNETLLIIHTSPGSASLIARLLDYHASSAQIIGTVAGDDSILVVPKCVATIEQTVAAVNAVLSSLR